MHSECGVIANVLPVPTQYELHCFLWSLHRMRMVVILREEDTTQRPAMDGRATPQIDTLIGYSFVFSSFGCDKKQVVCFCIQWVFVLDLWDTVSLTF